MLWPITESDIGTVQLTVLSFDGDAKNKYQLRWIIGKKDGKFQYKNPDDSTTATVRALQQLHERHWESRVHTFSKDARIINFGEVSEEHHMQFWRENKKLALTAAGLSEKNYKSLVLIGILKEGELEQSLVSQPSFNTWRSLSLRKKSYSRPP